MNHAKQNIRNIFSIITFSSLLISSIQSIKAAEESNLNTDLFQTTNPIVLTLDETIPEDCQMRNQAIRLLKETQLTSVKTDPTGMSENATKKEVGFSFPVTAPWCLLTAKYIKSLNFRPNMGDWGCGHGFFSRHALLSGANPYAIDSSLPAAQEANKVIFGFRAYLPLGLNVKELYKASNVSVVKPGSTFMSRQNHINVAFNVIHYLNPTDADLFLTNLYNNTLDNGLIILCCDTPFDQNNVGTNYYNHRTSQGLRYPGFGVYNSTNVIFLDDLSNKRSFLRSICDISPEEEKSGKFKMGELYNGMYPLDPIYDNGQTIQVDSLNAEKDIFGGYANRPYRYATSHQTFNKFDYKGLKNVLELAGFTVVNGWYTDHNLNTLYHHDDEANLSRIRKSKVVIVAQKTTVTTTTTSSS